MKLLCLVTAYFFFQSAFANSPFPEFEIIKKNQSKPLIINLNQVIHETDHHLILKSALTNFESFDYYFIQLTKKSDLLDWYKENTEIVAHQDGEFLVAKISNEKQLHEVASKTHSAGHFCGGMQKLSATPIELIQEIAPLAVLQKDQNVANAITHADENNILETMQEMASWKTRYQNTQSGMETPEKLLDLYRQYIPNHRQDVSLYTYPHKKAKQDSMVVRIEGTQNPDQIVILGSHIDSLNQRNNNNAPGVDDNASGTSTNLEVFRVLMETDFRPKNTIEIHGYAAEEIGLIGSDDMAETYKKDKKNVISMVQFDMNAYTKTDAKISFVTNSTSSGLTNQMIKLVEFYLEIPYKKGFLWFGTSDHASWRKQGFPVAFPTEDPSAWNKKIHTEDDTLANTNSPLQIREFAKLGVAYLMHFGGY